MRIENLQVYGFESAIRAMRNPMDSWNKSDSFIGVTNNNIERFVLGEKDADLSRKLVNGGTEHAKHLRLIQTWVDLTLPRYVWAEFDTYKHVEKVSCSTIHKLTAYKLDNSFFEYPLSEIQLERLNRLIQVYKESKDINDFYILKNELPEGFLQKRTVNVNYQTWLNILQQRSKHKLEQWHEICNFILKLPYFKELTGIE